MADINLLPNTHQDDVILSLQRQLTDALNELVALEARANSFEGSFNACVKELVELRKDYDDTCDKLAKENDANLALMQSQGEPVGEIIIEEWYVGDTTQSTWKPMLYEENELPPGTKLYTSAPTIPERWKLVRTERIEKLESALERLAKLGNEPCFWNSIGNQIAIEALKPDEPSAAPKPRHHATD